MTPPSMHASCAALQFDAAAQAAAHRGGICRSTLCTHTHVQHDDPRQHAHECLMIPRGCKALVPSIVLS